MNNAQKYFKVQLQNEKFSKCYNEISEQVDIEWELEKVKNQIINNTEKSIITREIEKLQKFVQNSMFARYQRALA